MKVRKASGELQDFDPEKARRSLRRTGVDEFLIKKIIEAVESELYEGITTREIYRRVFQLLRDEKSPAATRYTYLR